MKSKKIILGVGALALVGVGYYMMKKKKVTVDTATDTTTTTVTEIAPYTIAWSDDPTKAVFVVIKGKKYPFVSEKAFVTYGYSAPKSVTKAELDLIPKGGFVSGEGKVIEQ